MLVHFYLPVTAGEVQCGETFEVRVSSILGRGKASSQNPCYGQKKPFPTYVIRPVAGPAHPGSGQVYQPVSVHRTRPIEAGNSCRLWMQIGTLPCLTICGPVKVAVSACSHGFPGCLSDLCVSLLLLPSSLFWCLQGQLETTPQHAK